MTDMHCQLKIVLFYSMTSKNMNIVSSHYKLTVENNFYIHGSLIEDFNTQYLLIIVFIIQLIQNFFSQQYKCQVSSALNNNG